MKAKSVILVRILVKPNENGELHNLFFVESLKNLDFPKVVSVGSVVGQKYVSGLIKKKDIDVVINTRDCTGMIFWCDGRGGCNRGHSFPTKEMADEYM